jgi:thioesterase domain-containing protein
VLEFLGRLDDQVKIRGHRIEPREIAACLEEHPSVGQAVVVPRADTGDDATLVAYVVPRVAGQTVDEAALAAHAAERLPQYMIPRAFVVIPVVPLTPNGKLDTAALPKPPAVHETPSSAGASPTEPIILAMWREILAQPGLGPDDDFFAAGGHSLLAVRMLARLERDLGVRLPARVLFEASTPRRFAALVAGMKAGPEPELSSIVRIRDGLGVVPLFCLPGVGGHAFQYRELAARMRTERPILALQVHDLDVPVATIESIQLTADAFVARMRAVRPHGPYALTGYSYGGIVALEIARRLTALGETVSFLGLVDTYAPGAAVPSPRLKKIGKHLANLADMRSFGEVVAYLSNRVRRRTGRIAFVLREMFDRAGDPKSNLERRVEDTAMRCIRAYYSYEARPYAGRVTVFRASRLIDWEEVRDPTNTCGWGPICRSVDVVDIDCEHLELFKEPHLSELARRLDEALESAGDGF